MSGSADDRPAATATALDLGRAAYARQSWAEAARHLTAADGVNGLALEDLERLILAVHLLGRESAGRELLARAHREAVAAGQPERAARSAFWLGLELLQSGEEAQGNAWLARAGKVLDGRPESVEHGYLRLPAGLGLMEAGEFELAGATFADIERIGEQYRDPDLATLGRLGRGEALIGLAETGRGVAFLDDAMLAVTGGEVSPLVSGIVYCSVIEACQGIFDLRRAREWTEALDRWCADHPDMVRYRGECLVYRAELMQLQGAWDGAVAEAAQARARLTDPGSRPALGAVVYLEGELHRLRGDLPRAERAFRDAASYGRATEPGLAMVRLAQGRIDAAATAIELALDERGDRRARPGLLEARVRIAIAAGELNGARAAAEELAVIARELDAPLLHAMAGRARGHVMLEQGEARGALGHLRTAWRRWQALDAPYEAAGIRVLTGVAYRVLGDEARARMELEAARDVYRRLGAAPDVATVDGLLGEPAPRIEGLTAREVEVLRLVAQGRTNRAIAAALVISEKTVARHLANIFTKLDVPSRAAATAWAYEHAVVDRTASNHPSHP